MSHARQIADSTVLLIVTQTRQIGGRWHLAECRFTLVLMRPTYRIVPVVTVDRVLFRLTQNTGRPRGYRLRTNPETNAWHREAPCWKACQHVQVTSEPDYGLTYHIHHDCSARCRAVQETVARNASILGTSDERLRVLASDRQKSGEYLSDDGDALRALYGDDDRTVLRRGGSVPDRVVTVRPIGVARVRDTQSHG